MKRYLTTVLLIGIFLPLAYSQSKTKQSDKATWSILLKDVQVVAKRPMSEIGVQKTKLDTLVLHENVSLSMADMLTQNTTIFVKSYGRATLSTVSFRGTSPSHTQVDWNGMKLNSPMLGMVDFSEIPSYFIDDANLLHGTSSINVTGGGLGGSISLSTKPVTQEGLKLQYIQSIGSFKTFDEYLRLTYANNKWNSSTRVVYSSSPNQYKYTNYKKPFNQQYDSNRKLISAEYPVERNKSGDFKDFHLLQELYYDTRQGDKFKISGWLTKLERGIPFLNVDYKNDAEYINLQRTNTFRGVASWDKTASNYSLQANGGYSFTNLRYDYSRDLGNGKMAEMIRSKSLVNTFFGKMGTSYHIGKKYLFNANLTVHQHFVRSEDKNIITQQGGRAVVGYDRARMELSGYFSSKWRATDRLSLSLAVRQDTYGKRWTPIIPAAFLDFVISEKGNLVFKSSISRNYRYPTLNDLYFLPGGNPDLKEEKGFTYDAGIDFSFATEDKYVLKGSITAFNSYIKDWIVWLPTFKGFWSPKNVKEVHSYGIELKGELQAKLTKYTLLKMNGNFAYTPTINGGDPVNWADKSIGKQLVYIPKKLAAVTGNIIWKDWAFSYKWSYYSERFTTSSNQTATKIGLLLPYFMSDIDFSRKIDAKWADLQVKGVIRNLFNEEYESVLSRPMPRQNYQIILQISPKF